MKSPVLTAIGATLLAAALPLAGCASTPTAATATDARSGEGSCGGEKKTEGSCGGEQKTTTDGEKKAEGSCGEGSCGEGSCGGTKTP